jgi:signal transduction histidine kinase
MTREQSALAFDISTPFAALCDEVLGASSAFLIPVGAFAPLVGQAISYPTQLSPPLPLDLNEIGIVSGGSTPQTMCVAVDPLAHGGAAWAVPLWSERGLIGVLMLGEKRNGSLYTQEEIEIARASGERLIDLQAGAEMSRRLMAMQRTRMAQNQVVDHRTRRMLHDEILPRLHAAMLMLPPEQAEIVGQLGEVHHQIADLLRASAAAPEVSQLGLIPALRKAVESELGGAFDDVTWDVEPDAEMAAQNVPVLTAEVLYYAAREAMRYAAVYGRGDQPKRPLHLRVAARGKLSICVEDDGVGLERTSSRSSGHGLSLHSTMMAVIGGALTVESAPDQYTRVTVSIPLD